MAIEKPGSGSAKQAPKAEAKQASNTESKKPQDNSAAKNTPKEAQTAVSNTFGKVPNNDNPKLAAPPPSSSAGGDAKTPTGGDAKTPTGGDAKTPTGGDAKTPTGGDAKTPTGGDAKTPAASDPKSAPGNPGDEVKTPWGEPSKTPDGNSIVLDTNKHPIAVGKDGNPIVDPKGNPYAVSADGKFMQPEPGKYAVYDHNNGKMVASDPNNGERSADPSGNQYALDKNGQYMQPEPGTFAIYDNAGNLVASDPQTGKVKVNQFGDAYAVSEDGKYMSPEAGKSAVYEKNTGLMVAVDNNGEIAGRTANKNATDIRDVLDAWALDKNGQYLTTPDGSPVGYDFQNGMKLAAFQPKVSYPPISDGSGNPYVIKPDGSYAVTENGNPVVYDHANGNAAVAIDGTTGQAIKDTYGNILAVGENGNFIKTPDGQSVIYNQDNGNTLAVTDPASGKVVQDSKGNPYMVLPDGKYAKAGTDSDVVYDKANGNKPVGINPQTGAVVKGPGGQALAVGEDGNFIKTETGMQVVYENTTGKFNPVATNGQGEILVLNEHPVAVDKYGKQVFTPDQLPVVYDSRGNKVVLGADNKIVTDEKGNALAIGKNSQYLPSVVYDKFSGNKVKLDHNQNIQKSSSGRPIAVDENGEAIFNSMYDQKGDIVLALGTKTPAGYEVVQNWKTGQLQAGDQYIYKVDPATNDFAKDAEGNTLPPIYNPVDNDPSRPPVVPNEDPGKTIENLPFSIAGGDPMKIKDELFDEKGYLNQDKLNKALDDYDVRDVYDALINSSKFGGWNNLPPVPEGLTTNKPSINEAKEVVAAILAWQNANGKYKPLKVGEIPPIVLYGRGAGQAFTDAFKKKNLSSLGSDNPVYVDTKLAESSGGLVGLTFSELAINQGSKAFAQAYASGEHTGAYEIVAEYIASNWTGDKTSSITEAKYKPGFEKIEQAVLQLGNGDRDKGIDLLKRAYLSGDMAAIEALKKIFPPSTSASDYATPG